MKKKPPYFSFFRSSLGRWSALKYQLVIVINYLWLPNTKEVSPSLNKHEVIFRSRKADGSFSSLRAHMPTIQPLWMAPYRWRKNSKICFHSSLFSNITSFTAGQLPHQYPRQPKGTPGKKLLSLSSVAEHTNTNFICLGQRTWPFHF